MLFIPTVVRIRSAGGSPKELGASCLDQDAATPLHAGRTSQDIRGPDTSGRIPGKMAEPEFVLPTPLHSCAESLCQKQTLASIKGLTRTLAVELDMKEYRESTDGRGL